jgi:hypothetical protein
MGAAASFAAEDAYQSGAAIKSWVHFSGLAVAEGCIYSVDHDSRVCCFGLK